MSFLLKAGLCVFVYFTVISILVVVTPVEPHYKWKVYYKLYLEDYSQTKYFRTHFEAKRYYRKWKKGCKWIYINRLKG